MLGVRGYQFDNIQINAVATADFPRESFRSC